MRVRTYVHTTASYWALNIYVATYFRAAQQNSHYLITQTRRIPACLNKTMLNTNYMSAMSQNLVQTTR